MTLLLWCSATETLFGIKRLSKRRSQEAGQYSKKFDLQRSSAWMYRQTVRSYLSWKSLAELKALADVSVTWVSTLKIRNLLQSSRAVVVGRPWTASRKQLGEVGRDFLEWKSSGKKKTKHWDLSTIIGIVSTPSNNQTQDIGRVGYSSVTYLRIMYKFQNHKIKKKKQEMLDFEGVGQ